MRRISIHIRSKRNPDVEVPGYLVVHELGTEALTFFSTKKFTYEEELEVTAEIHGSPKKYEVRLSQCNEQISSGRVMTSVPVEGAPLPTRTFYRCFSKVLSIAGMEVAPEAGETAPVEAATAEVIPITGDATPAAEPAAEEQKAA